jgi:DNA recombination protein RmuC
LISLVSGRSGSAELSTARSSLDSANTEIAALRKENKELIEERGRLTAEREGEAQKTAWLAQAKTTMEETFKGLAANELKSNSVNYLSQAKDNIASMLGPLRETLDKLGDGVKEIEGKREKAYGQISEQLTSIGNVNDQLRSATGSLTSALKTSSSLGNWGEVQLHNVVELAGMQEHVDFEEQKQSNEEGKPDLIIKLADGGVVPVDAKTPLSFYMEACEAKDADRREEMLAKYVGKVREHVNDLKEKKYWEQFDKAPDFVVMFIPNEAAVAAAFVKDQSILEWAMKQKVLLATPVSLLAVLKAAAYGWRQHQTEMNIQEIARNGRDLYDRFVTFFEHLGGVGKSLDGAVESFNSAVGSVKERLLPGVRKFRELGVVGKELKEPKEIEQRVRRVESGDK